MLGFAADEKFDCYMLTAAVMTCGGVEFKTKGRDDQAECEAIGINHNSTQIQLYLIAMFRPRYLPWKSGRCSAGGCFPPDQGLLQAKDQGRHGMGGQGPDLRAGHQRCWRHCQVGCNYIKNIRGNHQTEVVYFLYTYTLQGHLRPSLQVAD